MKKIKKTVNKSNKLQHFKTGFPEKTEIILRKTQQRKVTPTTKKLGKGLEDISYLFLSGSDKNKQAGRQPVSSRSTVKKIAPKTEKTSVRTLESASVKKTKKVSAKAPAVKAKIKTKARINKTEPIIISRKTGVITMDKIQKNGSTQKNNVEAKKVSKTEEKKSLETLKKKTSRLGSISELKTLFKKKISQPVPENIQQEQVIEESKFFVGPAVSELQKQEIQASDIPSGYGDNRIVIQVRDPYWLHSYWEITAEKINSLRNEIGDVIDSAKRILRIYDITNVVFDGSNANKFFDIEINNHANNWYIHTGEAGRGYCVDIGLILPDGRFILLARSNCVATPIDGPSWITDEEWMVIEDDFNRLYGLSAGLGIGLSSMELRKQIKEKMKHISSGMVSSAGLARKAAERKFWLVVNTELIVYGATEPDASVSIQGRPIKLNADGTFSIRFALPDGEQVIPVKAVSADGFEERVITPEVQKKTT
ncbi:MAG: DUF4912 domain-containing protein [Candidatus Omnitrophica bacterium]|nr:DUF4912 domain-containing protein [Candidatus Omnitrophota bacterium]